MKIWLLAVLVFAVLPQHPSQTAKQAQQQANGGKKVSSPPTAVVEVPAAPKAPDADSSRPENDDQKQPVKIAQPIAITTNTDYAAWFFSALLVGVGGFQAYLLFKTMRAIEQQAAHMKHQTSILEKSTAAAEANAEAAKANAESAKRSIEIMISKERARIRIEIEKFNPLPASEFTYHQVDYRVFSYGATAAFISDSVARVEISNSAEPPNNHLFDPPASLPAVLHPSVEGVGKFAILFTKLEQEDVDAVNEGTLFVHFNGSIKYRDVFDRNRETRFKYVWKSTGYSAFFASYGGYWLKTRQPEENSET